MEDEKDLIIRAIEDISDGGNNTAQEVREVLTRILNYTENEEQGEVNKKPFQIHSKSLISDDSNPNGVDNMLTYSFRGFTNHFANLTFDLTINKPNEKNIYSFKFQEDHRTKLIEILNGIVLQNRELYFVVPVIFTLNSLDNRPEIVYQNLAVKILFVNNEIEGITFDFLGIYNNSNSLEFPFPDLSTSENQLKLNSATSICFHAPN